MLKEFEEFLKEKRKENSQERKNPDAKALREMLSSLQIELKNHKLPVIVLLEGWGAAGKGGLIGRTIRELDPRFYKVATKGSSPGVEIRKPFCGNTSAGFRRPGSLPFLIPAGCRKP